MTPHRERKYQDRLHSPPRQRRRASSAQSAWFATNSIHEHSPDDHRTWLTSRAREVEASPDTVTSDVTSTLRSSRRPSVHGSGPDRLSPHRQPAMTSPREGRVDGWLIPRSASLEHLLSRARGCAGWRIQRLRVLAHPFRAHLGFPARLRRPFGFQDRLSPPPATGKTIRCAQGAFRAGGHPEEMEDQARRTGQGPLPLRG